MSDDIVKQLRDIAQLRGDMSGRIIPSACWEAADEIERLREAMHLMYAHYHADNGAELVATYEKAVRGE